MVDGNAEGCVHQSIAYSNAIAEGILPTANNSATSTSTLVLVPASLSYDQRGNSSNVMRSLLMAQGINFSNCSNCSVNINTCK